MPLTGETPTAISIATSSGTAARTLNRTTDCMARFSFNGTFVGFTGVFEGSADGTNFFPVRAFLEATGAAASGTITLADSTSVSYLVPCEGLAAVRFRATARTSGTLAGQIDSGVFSASSPFPLGNVVTGGTFSGVTLSGTTTLSGKVVQSDVGTLAAAGEDQGDAAAIVNQTTYVSAADGTKGVVLPAAAAGAYYEVYNLHASNGLKIYPASGDDINDGTQDAAITIEGKTLAVFRGLDATTWAAIFTPNT